MGIVRDGDDPFFLYRGKLSFSVDEIAISLFSLASHSSSELMELSESEVFRIYDDDGIGPEEVHSILDNGRCEKDIVFSFFEGVYPLFDELSWHLSMGDDHFHFFSFSLFSSSVFGIIFVLDHQRVLGDECYLLFHLFHATDTIVDDDDLSITFEFIFDRMGNS